jgi:hypothetical protein
MAIKIPRGEITQRAIGAGSSLSAQRSLGSANVGDAIFDAVTKIALYKQKKDEKEEKYRVSRVVEDKTAELLLNVTNRTDALLDDENNREKPKEFFTKEYDKIKREYFLELKKLEKTDPRVAEALKSNYFTTLGNLQQKLGTKLSSRRGVNVGLFIKNATNNFKNNLANNLNKFGAYSDFKDKTQPMIISQALDYGYSYDATKELTNAEYEMLKNSLSSFTDKNGDPIPLRPDGEFDYQTILTSLRDKKSKVISQDIQERNAIKQAFGIADDKDDNYEISLEAYERLITKVDEEAKIQRRNDLQEATANDDALETDILDKLTTGKDITLDYINNAPWSDKGQERKIRLAKKYEEIISGKLNFDDRRLDIIEAVDTAIFNSQKPGYKGTKIDNIYDEFPIIIDGKKTDVSIWGLFGKGLLLEDIKEFENDFKRSPKQRELAGYQKEVFNNNLKSLEQNLWPNAVRDKHPEGSIYVGLVKEEVRTRYFDLRSKGVSHEEASSLDVNNKDSAFYKINEKFRNRHDWNKLTTFEEKVETDTGKITIDTASEKAYLDAIKGLANPIERAQKEAEWMQSFGLNERDLERIEEKFGK